MLSNYIFSDFKHEGFLNLASKLHQQSNNSLESPDKTPEKNRLKRDCSFDDFIELALIGKGSFSHVYLVENQREIFAVKKMNKLFLLQEQQVPHIKEEKRILSKIEHPFIIKMNFYFEDEINLYYVYEFVHGGELFTRIRETGFFPNDVALFYACEVFLAIQFLHSKNIIYRDLKPENLLLDRHGHIKLIDFGFAKIMKSSDRCLTLCGTPEYMAPEVLEKISGYGFAADYWSLGVLIYEMLVGKPPFYDKEPYGIFEKIMKGDLKFPKRLSPSAKNLIRRLLDRNPETRLGSKDKGESIKKHPWFKHLDWDMILAKKVKAPWIPELNSESDTNNFIFYEGLHLCEHGKALPEEMEVFFENF